MSATSGLSATCKHCGPLPANEPLYDIAGEQFHAVIIRLAQWGPDPRPEEAEPCGPVANARSADGAA